MSKTTQQILAFTWYHEADYERLLEASRNTEGLEQDYETWLLAARRALVEYKNLGFEPHRVYIDVEEYLEWCESRDRAVNKHSREIFKEIKRQQFYRSLEAYEQQSEEDKLKNLN